ncbi:hypothetical protein ParaKuw1_00026 [Paracoccus phage ParKuw1]|uniref:Uncharacterized protein n=1 Tax=Paracoccus phage ParKuw1 TaxID=3032415 RepID=A0AAF0FHT0_9CAUD|nr:hypothetical protein ParaKuw1_00026 [Paracoccus phage ParKuw1]
MPVVTVTVNQWHIKENATEGTHKPVICVNIYDYVRKVYNADGSLMKRDFGPKIGETQHYYNFDVPGGEMIYDPVNKTPCGASCWMEFGYA